MDLSHCVVRSISLAMEVYCSPSKACGNSLFLPSRLRESISLLRLGPLPCLLLVSVAEGALHDKWHRSRLGPPSIFFIVFYNN